MSITVYSYKLTQRELEARLEPGVVMLPGQLLRIEGSEPAYGKVREVRVLPAPVAGMAEGTGVVIELLYGTPGLGAQPVTLLAPEQMARDVHRLQGDIEQPLQFAKHFVGNLANLAALTVVESDDLLLKYEALQVMLSAMKPYRRLLIIDPLGLFEEGDGFAYLKAGQDVRLSIQQVGSKRFLQAFGELFSPELRVPVLRTLAEHWPQLKREGEFVGFNHLLNLEAAVNVPLKNLIVQNYHAVVHNRIFADSPEQILNLGDALRQPVCVVDISDLPASWKSLFYEQLCETVFREGAGGLVPVLIYPEKYLPDLLGWAQRAEESGFNLLVMASPFAEDALYEKANNRVWVDAPNIMALQGALTLGLPVSFPLPANPMEYPTAFPPAGVKPRPTALQEHSLDEEVSVDLSLPEVGLLPPEITAEEPLAELLKMQEVLPEEEIAFDELEDLSSPDLDESLMDLNEDEADFDLDVASSGIIDLASPPPEPTISFLTAEQLSELLSSSPKTETAEEEGLVGTEPAPTLDYPDAEEGALPQAGIPLSSPVANIPGLFEDVLHEAQDVQDDSGLAYSSFQVDLGELEAPSTPSNETPAMPPPFPAPEEYEREEFNFDLNPSVSLSSDDASREPALEREKIADTVSRSLLEFEEMDFSVEEEPLFELNPQSDVPAPPPINEKEAEPGIEIREPIASDDVIGSVPDSQPVMSASTLDDAEMQEALNLIYPQQTTGGNEPEKHVQPVRETVPVLEEEEKVPIYPKAEMPHLPKMKGYQVGDAVRHKTYGLGVIQKVIPMDETVILNITFETVGKRLLDPSLCELKQDPD